MKHLTVIGSAVSLSLKAMVVGRLAVIGWTVVMWNVDLPCLTCFEDLSKGEEAGVLEMVDRGFPRVVRGEKEKKTGRGGQRCTWPEAAVVREAWVIHYLMQLLFYLRASSVHISYKFLVALIHLLLFLFLKPQVQVRQVAVKFASTVFPPDHIPSRYLLLLAAGDP